MNSVPEPSAEPPAPPDQEDILGRRIGAALIDLAWLIGLFTVLALAIGESTAEGGNVSLSLNGGGALLYFGLVLLYYFALEAAMGQTLGKLLLGLRVVRTDGSRPSVGAIAVRTLLRIVDWLPFFYLVGFITMMVTGQRRQRLGDLAAKTITARALSGRRWSLVLPSVALLLLLIVALSVYRATDSAEGENGRQAHRVTPLPTAGRAHRATPLPTGAILFRDDFSNRRSGWPIESDPSSSTAYVNGRYRISVRESDYIASYSRDLDHSSDAISITAVLRQTAGGRGWEFGNEDEFGVICVSRRPIVGYTLGITPTDRRGVGVLREIERGYLVYVFSVSYEHRAVKPSGKVNRIRADCVGTRGPTKPALLTLYANGKLIARGAEVPGYGYERFQGVGLYSYSETGGSTVLFDDVVVRELREG